MRYLLAIETRKERARQVYKWSEVFFKYVTWTILTATVGYAAQKVDSTVLIALHVVMLGALTSVIGTLIAIVEIPQHSRFVDWVVLAVVFAATTGISMLLTVYVSRLVNILIAAH